MSRTGLDAATLARSLRGMAGDGSVEWAVEPIQASVLLDMADALDENDKLREQIRWLKKGDILHVLTDQEYIDQCERERLTQVSIDALDKENAELRKLVRRLYEYRQLYFKTGVYPTDHGVTERRMRELGVEVDG